MCLWANRPIARGEEVTVSFTSYCEPRAERVKEIQRRHNFQCACAACTEPNAAKAAVSDVRRALIGLSNPATAEKFLAWIDGEGDDKAMIAHASIVIKAVEAEGLGWHWRQMGYLFQVARANVVLGRKAEALKFAAWWARSGGMGGFGEKSVIEDIRKLGMGQKREEECSEWDLRKKRKMSKGKAKSGA